MELVRRDKDKMMHIKISPELKQELVKEAKS